MVQGILSLFLNKRQNSGNGRFWTTDPLTGTCYQTNFQAALTWHQVRKSCQQQNAELLSVTEIHEQMYLRDLIDNKRSSLWIGLNSLNLKSGWQWSSGSPSPEPEKLCAVLNPRRGAQWENQQCEQKVGYICKKENSMLDPFILPSGGAQPVVCPEGWLPYADHCYVLHREPRDWKEALISCKESNGSLASIHKIEEHGFILSPLGYKATDELWIGLNDLNTQMYFEWSNGTPVTYTKWLHGEPTHATSGQENCVVMAGEDGHWADSACDRKLGYVCRRQPLQGVSGTGWQRHGFCCYLVGHTSVTFLEAKKACERSNGYLTSVGERYEQAYLTSPIGLSPEKYFWTGLSDMEEQGMFKWADGAAVLYTNWNSAMPGKKGGCAVLRTGNTAGLWDVQNCKVKAKFLCKKLAEKMTLLLAPETVSNSECPLGWNTNSSTNSCFKIFVREGNQKKTWFEARDFCKEIGGDLAAIKSEEEQNLIQNLIINKSPSFQPFWIGLHCLDPDGGLSWSDRSPVSVSNRKTSYFYNTGFEYCGTINEESSMSWINMHCEYSHDWICEIKKGIFNPNGNSTYRQTYSAVNIFRKVVFLANDCYVKIDFSQLFHEHYLTNSYCVVSVFFSWADGSPVHYAAWAPDAPNFAAAQENCVVLNKKDGLWNDIHCGFSNGFICERHRSFINTTLDPMVPPLPGGCPEDWLLFKNQTLKTRILKDLCADVLTDDMLNFLSVAFFPAFLTYHLKDVSNDPWIGLNDILSELNFVWTDRSAVFYTNWAPDCPKFIEPVLPQSATGKYCHADDTGKWSDEECYQSRRYICQKNSGESCFSSATLLDFTSAHSDGISYSVIHSKMNWEEAKKSCNSKASELASILDPYSQSLLFLLAQEYGEPLWIGLNSNMTNGKYQWIDKWKLIYSKWSSGEPKQKLACVYLDTDGTWKTASCKEELFSLNWTQLPDLLSVIAPTEPPELPGKCPESKGHKSWIPFHGHCYYFEASRKRSWSQAYQESANLVSIRDYNEANFLSDSIKVLHGKSPNFWIGLKKNDIDKTAVDFVNWNMAEPSNNRHKQCGEVCAPTGYWNSNVCSFKKGYICKKTKREKKQKVFSTSIIWLFVVLVLSIVGAGSTVYFYLKFKKKQNQLDISTRMRGPEASVDSQEQDAHTGM
uniref:C-type lectin domain-containing protein n=1 Tax=Apteryx owenii TaxID=8824 RepID=A0A8B9Q0T2_APTOW